MVCFRGSRDSSYTATDQRAPSLLSRVVRCKAGFGLSRNIGCFSSVFHSRGHRLSNNQTFSVCSSCIMVCPSRLSISLRRKSVLFGESLFSSPRPLCDNLRQSAPNLFLRRARNWGGIIHPTWSRFRWIQACSSGFSSRHNRVG